MGSIRKKSTPAEDTTGAEAEANKAAVDEANAAAATPESTPPEEPAPTTPTDPDEQKALADATAADIADKAADAGPPPPADMASVQPDVVPANAGPAPDPDTTVSEDSDLTDRDHARGCPAERLETYPATAPDGTQLKVSRCIQCGASVANPV